MGRGGCGRGSGLLRRRDTDDGDGTEVGVVELYRRPEVRRSE